MNFCDDCFPLMDVMLITHLLASLQLNGLTSLKNCFVILNKILGKCRRKFSKMIFKIVLDLQ